MNTPIRVHKCFFRINNHSDVIRYFKKESVNDCSICRGIPGTTYDIMLQESLVDAMNDEIFRPYRFEIEIVNNAKEFFEPHTEQLVLIDKTLRHPHVYKTSWKPKD